MPRRVDGVSLALLLFLAAFSAGRRQIRDHSFFPGHVSIDALDGARSGLFKKYNIDHELVFIASSGIVTAALLGGDADMTVTGGIGNVIAYVRGSTDVAFIGGVKNTMTQTLVAGGNIKKPEDLKGKRIGVSRIGGNSHYFTIQALRRYNMEPNRDFSFLQTGGDPETFAALLSGGIEVANLTPPTDSQAIAKAIIMWSTARTSKFPMRRPPS